MSGRRAAVAVVAALAAGLVMAGCTGTPAPSDEWVRRTPPLTTPWTQAVGPDNALPEYPRPQLARPSAADPTWLNLNGEWQYQPWDGRSEITFGADLSQRILVPYPIESALSGIEKHADYSLYRRTVQLPEGFAGDGTRLRLNFGAVTYQATVYVNGTEVVRHSGGFDAFSADITAALVGSGPQEIVVAVHSPVDAANVPVGKQRLDPGGIFYTAASGIWQTVWLEPVSAVSIASLTAVPDVDTGSFSVEATFNGDAGGTRLSVDAYADGALVGSASGPAGAALTVQIPNPRLWTPDDPFLYTFTATLSGAGVADSVESYAGLREIAVELVGGAQHITLNHTKTYLLGTLDQGYWPDGIYTAPSDEGLRFDIQKTKDLGFNTIRKHIKVEPARWYYWADTIGLMVWQDMPALPSGRNDSLTEADQENYKAESARIIEQLKGSTAIIGWVMNNEGWGQWSAQAPKDLAALAEATDPSRLVIARSGSNCCDAPGDPHAGDIIDWHAYQGPALPDPDRDRAAIDGEHGGLSLPIAGHAWPGADLNPYGGVADADALNAGYVENTAALRDFAPSFHISGSIYTQITDVENEQNGLFTYDRQVQKVDTGIVRGINLETIAAGSKV